MNTLKFRSCLMALALLLAGCSEGPKAPASPADLTAKLEAALRISNIPSRDDALTSVALDAADAGQGEVVVGALKGMSNVPARDGAAGKAAIRLAKAGQRQAANDAANLISNVPERDRILQKLAAM